MNATSPKLFISFVLLLITANACKQQTDVIPDEKEAIYSRLLVTDADGTTVSLINPVDRKSQEFQARFSGSSLYATRSGRYATLVNYANNYVQFFDSNIEAHNDHVHVLGQPKWSSLVSEAPKPTHVFFWNSGGDRVAIFNDGDATLALTTEYDLSAPGAKPKMVKVDVAHHGAVVAFSNNTFAVTQKDGTVSSTLPERVKIVDENGNVLKTSVLATKGIHGDAGNGELALFGHPEGILVVAKDGSQRTIKNPESFGQNWLSAVYYCEGTGTFYGYNAKIGVYRIDVVKNQIMPVVADDKVSLFKFDKEGQRVFALLTDGTLQAYDGKTDQLLGSAKVAEAIDAAATVKPDMTVSRKFVYISQPEQREIRVIQANSLARSEPLKLSRRPAKLVLFGAQLDQAD
ncbi:hypothetical protein GCM10028807_18110 [Spirosoma daeguense]